MNHVA